MLDDKIGFIGAGKMGSAIIKGVLKAELVDRSQLAASDPVEALGKALTEETGVRFMQDNAGLVEASDIVFLAVKPQVMDGMLQDLAGASLGDRLWVSIAAGVPLSRIEALLPEGTRVVRVMPNTPCLVGQAASAYSGGRWARAEDLDKVGKILSSVGLAVSVDEHHLDAVTGLSGSGPAYVFLFIESLAAGGVQMGLSRDVALGLALQTVYGSAAMARDSKDHLAELRDAVTSPAGTTAAGLFALEQGAFRATVMEAVVQATERSEALGRGEHS
jgi:pyrroline-5-carboxylate reductase